MGCRTIQNLHVVCGGNELIKVYSANLNKDIKAEPMQKRNSTTKNAAWIISCKIVQALLGVIVNMLSARYLGPSNYGLLSYAASIVAFVLPIVQLGFRSTLVSEIIDNPDKEGEIIGTSLFFNLLSSIACIVGVSAFVYVANPNEITTLLVCALYSISLIAQALEMICYWYQAKLIAQYTSITGLVAYIIVTIYKIYLLATNKSVYWFAVANALDYFIIAIVLIVFYFKLSNQKLKVSFKRFRQMFAKSKFFIISSLMVTIFAQTDKIMLKGMMTEKDVGIYSAAVTCAGMTSFVFAAIIDSFRPAIFENKKISVEAYEKSIIVCYSVIIFLSLAQSIVCTVFSKLIIAILYGAEYAESAKVLGLVVWYTTFSYLGPIRNVWILAENKQKYLWIINLSGAVCNVLLNAVLIPVMGIMGAACASLITQIFTNVIIGFIMKPIRDNNRLMLKGCNPIHILRYVKRVSVNLKKKSG